MRCFVLLSFCGALVSLSAASGDVVVIANRSDEPVAFAVHPSAGKSHPYSVLPGDVAPVSTLGKIRLTFGPAGQETDYLLDANSAYFFGSTSAGELFLEKIGLEETERTADGTGVAQADLLYSVGTIAVKILVDDDQPATRRVWENRLNKRMEAASDILEKHCRLRLKVVNSDIWDSDDKLPTFEQSLAEFEREVRPVPAMLAIGFTSQHEISKIPLGPTAPQRKPEPAGPADRPGGQEAPRVLAFYEDGTRSPLYSHILIRDRSAQATEAERLELLVHELGHFLGAIHSPEPDSVMRPLGGDVQARLQSFRIGFDPVNTLAINLVAEEIRFRQVKRLSGMSQPTKLRLGQIYSAVAKALPGDPVANRYLDLMGGALADSARYVVQSVVREGQANLQLPIAGKAEPGKSARRTGDALTDHYVRTAARAAQEVPAEIAPSAFLLGLGIALGDTNRLLKNSQTSDFCQTAETAEDRARRLEVLGLPTMRDRRYLAEDFFVAAYLAVVLGRSTAELEGLTEEASDAKRPSGFSFADLAANQAGVLFAEGILARKFSLSELATGFSARDFMPPVEELPRGLTLAQFRDQYGSPSDPRYQEVMAEIRRRLESLPPHRSLASTPPAISNP